MPSTRTVAEIETELAQCRTAIARYYDFKASSFTTNQKQVARPAAEQLATFIEREKELVRELQKAERIAAGATPGIVVRYGVPCR